MSDILMFIYLLLPAVCILYVRDIVDADMSYRFKGVRHRGEILFDTQLCSFATKNISGVTMLHHLNLTTIKVIGNIHENPELLGEKND